MPNTDYFKDWYQKNKGSLATKRKAKYQTNPDYRAKRLASSYRQRERSRKVLPAGCEVNFSTAAKRLDITFFMLREWSKRKYFPEPVKYAGRMWFTENQVLLMEKLAQFFNQNGSRTKNVELSFIVDWIFANW
jgi:hypothetical protein